jgi:hypothetical protein
MTTYNLETMFELLNLLGTHGYKTDYEITQTADGARSRFLRPTGYPDKRTYVITIQEVDNGRA